MNTTIRLQRRILDKWKIGEVGGELNKTARIVVVDMSI